MTDHAVLRAAIRSVVDRLDCCDRDALTDDIMAAIVPVLDEGVTVEWAARCTRPNCACTRDGDGVFFIRTDQARTLAAIAEDGGSFELVSRRAATDWEAAE